MVSCIAFAAHIVYERMEQRVTAGSLARHVAIAVAFGAFALAIRANVHEYSVATPDQYRTRLLASLILWPLLLGIPAFLVAYCANALFRFRTSV